MSFEANDLDQAIMKLKERGLYESPKVGVSLRDAKSVREAIKSGKISKAEGDLLLEGWGSIEREAKVLDDLTKARLTLFDQDVVLRELIVKEAHRIVAKVMQANAEGMNRAIENNMRELLNESFGDIEERVKQIFERETRQLVDVFKKYDASQRPVFIAEMEEISGGKREGDS